MEENTKETLSILGSLAGLLGFTYVLAKYIGPGMEKKIEEKPGPGFF